MNRTPGFFERITGRAGKRESLKRDAGKSNKPRTRVGRIGGALNVAGPSQLIDQETGGLFGDLRSLGQLGQSTALLANPLKYPRLCRREVVEACGSKCGKHAGLHGPVRDE